jgi:hypothetical protein
MFAIELAKVTHVLVAIKPKDLSSIANIGLGLPCYRSNKTEGPKRLGPLVVLLLKHG